MFRSASRRRTLGKKSPIPFRTSRGWHDLLFKVQGECFEMIFLLKLVVEMFDMIFRVCAAVSS